MRAWAACSLGAAAVPCLASGLQVAPVTLSLPATQTADGLWLSNIGSEPLVAQVRVYRWTQQNDGNQLAASTGLVISPPAITLAAGERQLIRVIRVIRAAAPPAGDSAAEDAYRLAIDELPTDRQGKGGLQYVLHYSVPIFVEPRGGAGTPRLDWKLVRSGDHVMLEVSNHGARHAQLAALTYIDSQGRKVELLPGLLGYVLPGTTMHWAMKPGPAAFTARGTIQALVNGDEISQELSLTDRGT